MSKIIQTLTAYEIRLRTRYKKDEYVNLGNASEFKELFGGFFSNLKESVSDEHSSRLIALYKKPLSRVVKIDWIRISVNPEAGKDGMGFTAYEKSTKTRINYDDNYSAIYEYNVYLYYHDDRIFAVFHRFGNSGCKTVFFNAFNKYIKENNLISEFDILFSDDSFDENSANLESLTLITNEMKADAASNLLVKTGVVEEERTINLKTEKYRSTLSKVKDIIKGVTGQSDLVRELGIRLKEDFHQAKVGVRIGSRLLSISLDEFSGMLAQYDITEKLEYNGSRLRKESLDLLSDDYIASII